MVIAATGDDKVNLVTSLLAKTEFAVPRTVARVNHPNNEWLFTEAWGVDVNVSTPRIMSALVEEAVTVGDIVRLFTFRQGNANLVEITLPEDSPYVGKPVGLIPWPENTSLVTILRDGQVYTPGGRAADRGRRRAAVRQLARGRVRAAGPALPRHRRVSSRPECELAGRPRRCAARPPRPAGPALDRGAGCGASSQAIPASAAICSGQPMTTLLTPSAATIAPASSAARPAR